MNKEEFLKEIKVVVKSEVYYENRIVRVGHKLTVKRYQFSPYLMVAIDSKGEALEEQPEKCNTAEVREALGMDKKVEAANSYPVIGEAEEKAKEENRNKAIADAAIKKAADEKAAEEEEAAIKKAADEASQGGASALV